MRATLTHKTLNLAEASFSCSVNYFVIRSSSSYSPTPNPTSDLLHGMLHGKARALSRSPPCSSKNIKKLPFVSILSSFFHVATCSLPTLVSHARARARLVRISVNSVCTGTNPYSTWNHTDSDRSNGFPMNLYLYRIRTVLNSCMLRFEAQFRISA